MLASTGSPAASARAREVTTTAAAPSEIWEALPAVMVPSGENAGRSLPRASAGGAGPVPPSRAAGEGAHDHGRARSGVGGAPLRGGRHAPPAQLDRGQGGQRPAEPADRRPGPG